MGIRGLALAVALALPLAAADLGARIRAAIDASPATRAAFWGIQVAGVESGRTLFALNAERLFVPASNTKLFTTALALLRLGPEHRFRTTVLAPAISDAAG
ncbi:MAG: D-alanyl-D-alanine carboxypeptidase, partial [Acidobacteria bacterium]|nr:D-alanyl-D-alanine carboxypeptidase [Acidobacteriota bacterium]